MLYRELFNQYSKFLHLHNLWFDLSYGYQIIYTPTVCIVMSDSSYQKTGKRRRKRKEFNFNFNFNVNLIDWVSIKIDNGIMVYSS